VGREMSSSYGYGVKA